MTVNGIAPGMEYGGEQKSRKSVEYYWKPEHHMRIILSIAIVFSYMLVHSQPAAGTAPGDGPAAVGMDEPAGKRKVRFNMEFGTTFMAGSFGNYFGTYVAPQVSYPLSNRFLVSAGGYFSGLSPVARQGMSEAFGYPYAPFYSRSYFFVSGAYRLTDNVTVTGTAYREFSPFGPAQLPPGFSPEARGLIMGIDYRIGDHILIRGEVEVREGYSPFYHDPFMNPGGRRMVNPFFYGP